MSAFLLHTTGLTVDKYLSLDELRPPVSESINETVDINCRFDAGLEKVKQLRSTTSRTGRV